LRAEARYRDAHREELNQRAALYRAANPEKHLAAVKRWNANNPERRRIAFDAWRKRPGNDIGCSLRGALWRALKHRESGRDWRSDCKLAEIIGCSKPDLIAHIEAQFLPGMSWENYGRKGWELDHLRPCATFDLTQHEQVLACFHWNNLRPLWGAHNQRRQRKE
jgi:Prasinovirus endonuclease VII